MKELYKTFQEITPDCLESIHEELKTTKGWTVYGRNDKEKKTKILYDSCSYCKLWLFCLFILWPTSSKIYATVALDVNPSVELDIDDQHMIQKSKS